MNKTFEQVLRDKLHFAGNGVPRTISLNVVAQELGDTVYIKIYGVRLPFVVVGDTATMLTREKITE